MPRAARAEKQYHHGDLRNALILAAAELIQERGTEDFSMAEAARRAGVSNAAPYRHFKDKDDLLAGVCELAFWAFGQEIQAVLDKHQVGSRDCVVALGQTYVDFVSRHGPFFDLMWGDRHLQEREGLEALMTHSSFSMFYGAVESWIVSVGGRAEDAMDLAMKLWCMAHGMSALSMNGQLTFFQPDIDTEETLRSATDSFLDGVEMRWSAAKAPGLQDSPQAANDQD